VHTTALRHGRPVAPQVAGAPIVTPDQDTAWFLHSALGCEVAALVAAECGTASAWLMIWPIDAVGAEALPPVTTRTSCDANRLPKQADTAFACPGGVELTPGPPPVRCQLVVPLQAGCTRTSAWYLGRGGRAFSPEEVQLATVLAPGLRLRLHRSAVAAQQSDLEPLTAREQGVVELVARGLTSRAIARQFDISERTVHKHLQHIYRKTGNRDRLSAVLHLRDAGLLML